MSLAEFVGVNLSKILCTIGPYMTFRRNVPISVRAPNSCVVGRAILLLVPFSTKDMILAPSTKHTTKNYMIEFQQI